MPAQPFSVRHLWRSALTVCPHRLCIAPSPSLRFIHTSRTRHAPSKTATAIAPPSPSEYFPSLSLPPLPSSSRLSSLFTPAHARQLTEYGYTVIDGAFGDAACAALQHDILFLHRHELLSDNHTHLVTHGGQQRQLLPKRGIREADTHTPGLDALIPACHALTQDLSLLRSIAARLPALGLQSQSAKVQLNAGDSGCFPLHFDAYHAATGSDHRHVTAILYLNDGYQPSHGGQLQLHPLPYAPVSIEPRWDRLVMFASASLLHRVLPSSRQRLCVTLWMAGQQLPARPFPLPLPSSIPPTPLLSALCSLLHPRVYPHYCKLLLSAAWARSIEESHGTGLATDAAVAQHWRDVDVVRQALHKWTQHVPDGLLGQQVAEEGENGLARLAGVQWRPAAEPAQHMKWEELHRFL